MEYVKPGEQMRRCINQQMTQAYSEKKNKKIKKLKINKK